MLFLLVEIEAQNNYINFSQEYILKNFYSNNLYNNLRLICNKNLYIVSVHNIANNSTEEYYISDDKCTLALGIYSMKDYTKFENFLNSTFILNKIKNNREIYLEYSNFDKKVYSWELVVIGDKFLISIIERK